MRSDDSQLDEEQRFVLHLEAAAELRVLDHRAVAHHQVLPALARKARLVALVQVLRERLEQRWRGRHRELHERRLAAGAHHRQQPVDRRLGRPGTPVEVLERLDPLDELGVLLQPQHRRRCADLPLERAQPAVGIGGLQRGLDHPLLSLGAGDRQPGRARRGARVVHLQRQRRLAEQQPPPPPPQQALVQRPEHRHDGLDARVIASVGLDPQAHVATPAAGAHTCDRDQ